MLLLGMAYGSGCEKGFWEIATAQGSNAAVDATIAASMANGAPSQGWPDWQAFEICYASEANDAACDTNAFDELEAVDKTERDARFQDVVMHEIAFGVYEGYSATLPTCGSDTHGSDVFCNGYEKSVDMKEASKQCGGCNGGRCECKALHKGVDCGNKCNLLLARGVCSEYKATYPRRGNRPGRVSSWACEHDDECKSKGYGDKCNFYRNMVYFDGTDWQCVCDEDPAVCEMKGSTWWRCNEALNKKCGSSKTTHIEDYLKMSDLTHCNQKTWTVEVELNGQQVNAMGRCIHDGTRCSLPRLHIGGVIHGTDMALTSTAVSDSYLPTQPPGNQCFKCKEFFPNQKVSDQIQITDPTAYWALYAIPNLMQTCAPQNQQGSNQEGASVNSMWPVWIFLGLGIGGGTGYAVAKYTSAAPATQHRPDHYFDECQDEPVKAEAAPLSHRGRRQIELQQEQRQEESNNNQVKMWQEQRNHAPAIGVGS